MLIMGTFAQIKEDNMWTPDYIISAIWLLGVIVAWFQMRHWSRETLEECGKEGYIMLTVVSLLSWLIYPIALLEWLSMKTK